MINCIKKRFGDQAICVGSPFEADHQLALLSNQGIIDYVHTNDSDLIVLGADVVLNLNKKNGKCWHMSYDTIANHRFPENMGVQETLSLGRQM